MKYSKIVESIISPFKIVTKKDCFEWAFFSGRTIKMQFIYFINKKDAPIPGRLPSLRLLLRAI